jgi:hypothetical protein
MHRSGANSIAERTGFRSTEFMPRSDKMFGVGFARPAHGFLGILPELSALDMLPASVTTPRLAELPFTCIPEPFNSAFKRPNDLLCFCLSNWLLARTQMDKTISHSNERS